MRSGFLISVSVQHSQSGMVGLCCAVIVAAICTEQHFDYVMKVDYPDCLLWAPRIELPLQHRWTKGVRRVLDIG